MKQFRTRELYADLYENEGKPLMVIIGGSRAGIWSISPVLLGYLKEHYHVLIFAYFGVDGLPEYLRRVPLEYFINGIETVKNMLNLGNEDIFFIGNSKGAEATLLIISKHFSTSHAVACVASCYAWQGLTKSAKDMFIRQSSWTYQGREVPYIRMKFDFRVIRDLMNKSYCSSYEKGIRYNMKREALIDLSNYKGKMLLLSAEKDNYWPSKTMCETIVKTFGNMDVTHKVLNQSGHYFQEYEEPITETIAFLKSVTCSTRQDC